MRLPMALGSILLGASQALASGGISCETASKPANITFQGGVTRGMGAPIYSFEGSFRTANKAVAQDLRALSFTREHLAQYWLDGKELRLVLYREREGDKPHGYVEITVLTKAAGDEGTYKGKFSATVFDATTDPDGRRTELAGRISCFVE